MFLILELEQYQAFILYGILLIIAIGCYYFAVRSRKNYQCPECKEEITTEYLEAKHCNICGAKLNIKRKEE